MRFSSVLSRSPLIGMLLVLCLSAVGCSPSVVEFTIGECVNLPDGTEISDFEGVDCAETHDAEVYALPQHPEGPDAPFPGQAALTDFANERCLDAFEDYVGLGYEQSSIFYTALSPSQDSWEQAEDRETVCLLVGEALEDGAGFAQLTGPKAGSAE